MYSKNVYRGRFVPKNPDKYAGNVHDIIYRSSYELKFMNWCDMNDGVEVWGSEEIVIPYRSPIDRKVHRYFPDFFIKIGDKKYLIEVKPYKFTKEPVIPKRKTKRFINEVMAWGVNSAKWEHAREYCLDRGWEFVIITEKELGLPL